MFGIPLSTCLIVAGIYIFTEAITSIYYPHNGKIKLALVARIVRIVIGTLMIATGVGLQ